MNERMTVPQIIEALGDSALYTLHAHTQWCDARMPMEEFAKKASQMGFTHYGFTPHSPITLESDCNMKHDDVPLFLAEVDRLQQMFPNVKFYKGMEVDYVDQKWCACNEYFQSLPLDYTISSVHFIPNQEGKYVDVDGRPASFQRKLQDDFHGDLRYVVDKFFEQSLKMIEAGGFEIIGHFDKIKLNAGICYPALEQTTWYKEHIDAMIDRITKAGVIVEINTKSWEEFHHMFPSQHHWRRLIKAGVPIVVNSDAHFVERINTARPQVLKSLRYLRNN